MPNATDEKKYLGRAAAEKLITNTKDALDSKQPKGDYALKRDIDNLSSRARIFFEETEPADLTANDLWIEVSDL